MAELMEPDCDYDPGYDDGGCYNCGGSGWIVVCIDDMCRGAGECIHGDGEACCPVCNKDGHKDPF
jgi:hypothetical protein